MRDLRSRVAVLPGAASGIGRATAAVLAGEGMKVVAADIDAAGLQTATDALRESGHEVIGVPTDVSSVAAIEARRDAALDAFGAVHVVHNNAGVVASGLIEEISLDLWFGVLDARVAAMRDGELRRGFGG